MPESITPTVRCPQSACEHPIDDHVGFESPSTGVGCNRAGCRCTMTPNLVAVAHLLGDLTQPPRAQHVVRQPDGSWS